MAEQSTNVAIIADDTRCEYADGHVFATLQEVFTFFFEPIEVAA
jgi:hypothetical protein